MNLKFLSLLWILLIPFYSQAQWSKCAAHQKVQSNPALQQAFDKTFEQARTMAASDLSKGSGQVYQIPVVVHIVYNTAAENLSDELVQSQIDVLNEAFRRQNADTSNTRDIFKSRAADAQLEFYLAQTDPQGNPTTGITRTQTEVQSFLGDSFDINAILEAFTECGVDPLQVIGGGTLTPEQEECLNNALAGIGGGDPSAALDGVKFTANGGIDAWDTKEYLNIWVCNLAIDLFGQQTPAVLGFAYPPTIAPNWPEGTIPANVEQVDGVVIHYQAFGKDNPNAGPIAATNSEGRTCVHEVGHYFGLRHIWGDGDCTADDGIEDTPDADAQSESDCDFSKNTCDQTDPISSTNLPDMVENYMDYSSEPCQNMFTAEQVGLMRSMAELARPELWNNGSANPLAADFIANKNLVVLDEIIQFTSSISSGDNGSVTYNWNFGDGQSSNLTNPAHAYSTEGTYTVMLTLNNGSDEISVNKTNYITVLKETVGIENIEQQITLFPNPSYGKVQVILPTAATNWTAQIFSIEGKSLQVPIQQSDNALTFDIAASGIYNLRLNNDKATIWKQFVVQ